MSVELSTSSSVGSSVNLPPGQNPPVIPAKNPSVPKKFPVVSVSLIIVFVVMGIGTGYLLSRTDSQTNSKTPVNSVGAPGTISAQEVEVGKTYGSENSKQYPDISEGILYKGGLDGEGTHHLVRPGGKSQTIYATSSTLDLDLFVGHKIQIRGETFAAQKAAWFMDIGGVKVIEKNVATPEPTPEPTPTPKATNSAKTKK